MYICVGKGKDGTLCMRQRLHFQGLGKPILFIYAAADFCLFSISLIVQRDTPV